MHSSTSGCRRRLRPASRGASAPMAPGGPSHDVLAEGLSCGLHRVERLMRLSGQRARPRRRGLPKDDGARSVIAGNILDRDFQADRPSQKRLADFTTIRTAEGWLCVAAGLDLLSRRVVGWSMKAERDASLVMDAPMMAPFAHRQGRCPASPGPGQPRQQRAAPAPDGRSWHRLLHEPGRQRLGQPRGGELLLVAEDRARCPQGLT